MAKSIKALLTGRIQMCKTNPSIAHIGLATHGRSIQIGSSLVLPRRHLHSGRKAGVIAQLLDEGARSGGSMFEVGRPLSLTLRSPARRRRAVFQHCALLNQDGTLPHHGVTHRPR
jgi:hypothetical protein